MSYVPHRSRLRGLSVEAAERFGKPCVGAFYAGRGIASHRLEEAAPCCVCGRPATNVHHWPPRSKRTFHLSGLDLRPSLFAVCGSGTTGCHGLWHEGKVRADWAWRTEASARAWWSGLLLDAVGPHDELLYEHGFWRFEHVPSGRTWRIG